jgi:glucosyl-dolichyl phosphate glucuronosyltransferase
MTSSTIAPKVGDSPPFVSVIIPTYNRSDYLAGALRSLIIQDYPRSDFEIIVVDNGSSDDTSERLRQLAKEASGTIDLRYVREERQGLVFARHTGAANARGDVLIFGDDDAIFDNNWISAIMDVYRKHSDVGAVGTKISVLWDAEPEPWVRRYEDVLGKLDYGPQPITRQGLYINGGSFSIRKEVLFRVGGFNPGQKGPYIVGDSEPGLCRKLAEKGILVAWTPHATMRHLQQSKVNGTLHDMKRRFRNNGICDAYRATFYNWTCRQVLGDFRQKSSAMLRRFLSAVRRLDWEQFRYDVPLELAYYLYYLKYLWLYRFSSSVRAEVSKPDWKFNSTYEAPIAEFLARQGKRNANHSGYEARIPH